MICLDSKSNIKTKIMNNKNDYNNPMEIVKPKKEFG